MALGNTNIQAIIDEIIVAIPWPLWFVGWSWKEAQDGWDWSGLCLGWPSSGKGEFRDAKRLAGNTKIHFPSLCQISSVIVMWLMMGFVKIIVRDHHHGMFGAKANFIFVENYGLMRRESEISLISRHWVHLDSKSCEYWADDGVSPAAGFSNPGNLEPEPGPAGDGPGLGTNFETSNHFL